GRGASLLRYPVVPAKAGTQGKRSQRKQYRIPRIGEQTLAVRRAMRGKRTVSASTRRAPLRPSLELAIDRRRTDLERVRGLGRVAVERLERRLNDLLLLLPERVDRRALDAGQGPRVARGLMRGREREHVGAHFGP